MIQEIIDRYKKYWWLQTKEVDALKKAWIINWIGWKGATLEPIINDIMDLPYFDSDRYKELRQDIEKISRWHDLDYTIWWSYCNFMKANLIFCIRLYNLLGWTKWYKRLWVVIFTFYILQTYGKQYFNFKN